jgi:hypothetical protein
MSISGSSRFINQSTLSIQQGQVPSAAVGSTNMLGGSSTLGLLSAGKTSSVGSGAISSGAANQLLGASGGSSLFSVASASSISLEGMQTQIMAMRESVPESQLAESVRPSETLGTNVDTSA